MVVGFPGFTVSAKFTGVNRPLVACTVTPPVIVPSATVSEAIPLASVTDDAGDLVALPAVTAQFTVTPGTGLLPASFTITDRAGRVAPIVSACAFPPLMAMLDADPGVTVATKVTVGTPVPDAVSVSFLTTLPVTQEPTVAMPDTSVAGARGAVSPPLFPAAVEKFTLKPVTGLLKASCTSTEGAVGRVVLICAVWLLPALTLIWVGVPAVPVAEKGTGPPPSVPEVAVIVFAPATVPNVQLPRVATPDALVVGVAPVRLPPPPVTAKVTPTPETGLP